MVLQILQILQILLLALSENEVLGLDSKPRAGDRKLVRRRTDIRLILWTVGRDKSMHAISRPLASSC